LHNALSARAKAGGLCAACRGPSSAHSALVPDLYMAWQACFSICRCSTRKAQSWSS